MDLPTVSRPDFPDGYVNNPRSTVSWDFVISRLIEAKGYWLCSVRPDGRPHVVPRWGVFLEGRFYYDGSPETRHARNIVQNPRVSLHLESASQVIIAEGSSRPVGKPERQLAARIAQSYAAKYAVDGYAPEPTQWDGGGLYEFTPHKVLAWTNFTEDPTRFTLAPA
jgi:nitroimidazol reductase NimA-like FMN-containing flavoprotein (pyridoxamine 5'-phosphate oxidase superfamily)